MTTSSNNASQPEARYRFQVVVGAAPQQSGQTVRVGQEATEARTAQAGLLPLPATAYLSDIRQAGVSVYDNGLVVGSIPLAPVEVLVRTDAGSLDGTVLNAEQKGVAGALVVLVPPSNRRQNPALTLTVRSDAQGRFSFAKVPPGSYKVFAWESVPTGAWQNAAFMAKVEARGTAVTIVPGTPVSANVPLSAD